MLVQNKIETKICIRCKEEKSLDEFYARKSRGSGHFSYCKQCSKVIKKEWKESNPEYYREWAKKNPDKIKESDRLYYEKNTEKCLDQSKKYREDHLEERSNYEKIYYLKNKEKKNKKNKEWHKEHPDYKKEWQLNHKEHLAKYMRERRKNNPHIRLSASIRAGIYNSLKQKKNKRSWEKILDYTLNDLIKHLESQFKEEMNWDNYGKGGWEIDHIIPISLFNITSVNCKGLKKGWALENLRPLWAKENNFKRAKLFIL